MAPACASPRIAGDWVALVDLIENGQSTTAGPPTTIQCQCPNGNGDTSGECDSSDDQKVYCTACNYGHYLNTNSNTCEAYSPASPVYNSYSGVDENSMARWYNQGKDYYLDVKRILAKAEHEIFITDWQLSMETELERPVQGVNGANGHTIGDLLKAKAANGVKIYIMLFGSTLSRLGGFKLGAKRIIEEYQPIANFNIMEHGAPAWGEGGRWSHHEKLFIVDRTYAFVGGIDLTQNRWDDKNYRLFDEDTNNVYWPGIDYRNPFVQHDSSVVDEDTGHEDNAEWYRDVLDRGTEPRMPWQDIASMVMCSSAQPIVEHFMKRWNFLREDEGHDDPSDPKEDYDGYRPPIDEVSGGYFVRPRTVIEAEELAFDADTNSGLPTREQTSKLYSGIKTQAIRSISEWGLGERNGDDEWRERSIQEAYIDLITNAEEYIYIETQYFISDMSDDYDIDERNKMGEAIYNRIKRASDEGDTDFKVIIVIPLFNELYMLNQPFDHEEKCDLTLHAQQAWIWKPEPVSSLCIFNCDDKAIENENLTLLGRLSNAGVNWENYIQFTGLRAFDKAKDATELIYVHSKLMIVDDKHVIIGSANINDRSLNGDHDSEMCIRYQDDSGDFGKTLRENIWKIFLGVENDSNFDDASIPFWFDSFRSRAVANTNIANQLFRVVPNDDIHTFEDLHDYRDNHPVESNSANREALFDQIQGVIADYPLQFLKDEWYIALFSGCASFTNSLLVEPLDLFRTDNETEYREDMMKLMDGFH